MIKIRNNMFETNSSSTSSFSYKSDIYAFGRVVIQLTINKTGLTEKDDKKIIDNIFERLKSYSTYIHRTKTKKYYIENKSVENDNTIYNIRITAYHHLDIDVYEKEYLKNVGLNNEFFVQDFTIKLEANIDSFVSSLNSYLEDMQVINAKIIKNDFELEDLDKYIEEDEDLDDLYGDLYDDFHDDFFND